MKDKLLIACDRLIDHLPPSFTPRLHRESSHPHITGIAGDRSFVIMPSYTRRGEVSFTLAYLDDERNINDTVLGTPPAIARHLNVLFNAMPKHALQYDLFQPPRVTEC